jgi:hypothetical protein
MDPGLAASEVDVRSHAAVGVALVHGAVVHPHHDPLGGQPDAMLRTQ